MSYLLALIGPERTTVATLARAHEQARMREDYVAAILSAMRQLDPADAWRATWLLGRCVQDRPLTEDELRRIARAADEAEHWATRLHFCQVFARCDCPPEARAELRPFLRECFRDERTIVRAWALTALTRCADTEEARRETRTMVREVGGEPSPAMQARLRAIRKRYRFSPAEVGRALASRSVARGRLGDVQRELPAGEVVADALDELVGAHGFQQVVVGGELAHADDRIAIRARGAHDDRQVRVARRAADAVEQIEPAHARHVDVGHDEIDVHLGVGELPPGRCAVARGVGAKTEGSLDTLAEHVATGIVVIGDEDAHGRNSFENSVNHARDSAKSLHYGNFPHSLRSRRAVLLQRGGGLRGASASLTLLRCSALSRGCFHPVPKNSG